VSAFDLIAQDSPYRAGQQSSQHTRMDKKTAVTLRSKVSELNGNLLEDGKNPLARLHAGYDNLLPKIEEALEGQFAGDQVTLDLQPQDAFGA